MKTGVNGSDRPFILGLTGSIGMGKSTVAAMFAARDVPVHDSDAVVHNLYSAGRLGGAKLASIFPSAIRPDGSVDRIILREIVIRDPSSLIALEAIIHPLVRAEENAFLSKHQNRKLVILDIPLLFETNSDIRCDAVLVVTASADIQRSRVLARPSMTEAIFTAILAQQCPDAEKKSRADMIIDTTSSLTAVDAQVDAIVMRFQNRPD